MGSEKRWEVRSDGKWETRRDREVSSSGEMRNAGRSEAIGSEKRWERSGGMALITWTKRTTGKKAESKECDV